MGVSKLSAKVFFFFKVNYSFKCNVLWQRQNHFITRWINISNYDHDYVLSKIL